MKPKILAITLLVLCFISCCIIYVISPERKEHIGDFYESPVQEKKADIDSHSDSTDVEDSSEHTDKKPYPDVSVPSSDKADAHGDSELLLPVANVSSKYADSAKNILNSFYCAGNIAPLHLFEGPLNSVILNQWYPDSLKKDNTYFYNEYCYYLYFIDPYFVDFKEIGSMIINNIPFEEVLYYCNSQQEAFYNHDIIIGVLCGIPENNIILWETMYSDIPDKDEDNFFFYHEWDTSNVNSSTPDRALYMDDDLMEKLENNGFLLDETRALSITIPAHSSGLYLSDGTTEKYYPLSVADGTNFLSINEMADMFVLGESLIAHTFDSMH